MPLRERGMTVANYGKSSSDGGAYFLSARLPAMASMGMIIRIRPISMSNPTAVLYQSVLAFNPAKAEPLLAAPDTNAYNAWLKPCGPGVGYARGAEAIDG